MTNRLAVFACPEGGDVTIEFPGEGLSVDTIDMLEEWYAIWFRVLRRRAEKKKARADAEVEYESWEIEAPRTAP